MRHREMKIRSLCRDCNSSTHPGLSALHDTATVPREGVGPFASLVERARTGDVQLGTAAKTRVLVRYRVARLSQATNCGKTYAAVMQTENGIVDRARTGTTGRTAIVEGLQHKAHFLIVTLCNIIPCHCIILTRKLHTTSITVSTTSHSAETTAADVVAAGGEGRCASIKRGRGHGAGRAPGAHAFKLHGCARFDVRVALPPRGVRGRDKGIIPTRGRA